MAAVIMIQPQAKRTLVCGFHTYRVDTLEREASPLLNSDNNIRQRKKALVVL